ncbi:hypothetical protein Lepto7375DRAFT_0564 [Leptolyngbya sp. PCC 7375]|nr:hypothetical protein Lepto7375DRAFT_0564 [Leptolyngbya sp. PCC 7375]
MALNPPWLSFASPIIGAASALLVYHRWIVDHRIKIKDDMILALERELGIEKRSNEGLKQQLDSATEETEKAYSTLDKFLEQIREQDISASDVLPVRRIMANFHKLNNSQRILNDYKAAAIRLRQEQPILVRKISQRTIREFKNSIPEFREIIPWRQKQNKQRFEADIVGYLNWVYECLYITGHPDNNPISDYVPNPLLSSADPYRLTVRQIVETGDWSTLTLDQTSYLQGMVEELLIRLSDEFS